MAGAWGWVWQGESYGTSVVSQLISAGGVLWRQGHGRENERSIHREHTRCSDKSDQLVLTKGVGLTKKACVIQREHAR